MSHNQIFILNFNIESIYFKGINCIQRKNCVLEKLCAPKYLNNVGPNSTSSVDSSTVFSPIEGFLAQDMFSSIQFFPKVWLKYTYT